MNIGETDADGWTYVSWIDAANAYALGTHETELSVSGGRFILCDGFFDRGSYKYRIREKARTITVTIPRPVHVQKYNNQEIDTVVCVQFTGCDTANEARDIIRKALEQS